MFDHDFDFLISGSEFDYWNLNSSIISFMTCVQNLRSIGLDLIGFGIEGRSWKFLSSLSLNRGTIHGFSVVWCDLRSQISSYDVLGYVNIFGWGPGGLGWIPDD